MAETGIVGVWTPADLACLNSRQLGQDPNVNLRALPVGKGVAFSFPKNKAVELDLYVRIPQLGALTTGVTVEFLLTDDGRNANDLGKVAVFGVTAKNILTDTDTFDITVSGGAEQTANCTLNAASGVGEVVKVLVPNANLDSAAISTWLGLRIRRVGDNVADTCIGPILCVGIYAFAY
jgi:hypothetical protein